MTLKPLTYIVGKLQGLGGKNTFGCFTIKSGLLAYFEVTHPFAFV
jgi:hypothetical protein